MTQEEMIKDGYEWEEDFMQSLILNWYEVKQLDKYSPVDFECIKEGKTYFYETKRRHHSMKDFFWLPLSKYLNLLNLSQLNSYKSVFLVVKFNDCIKKLEITESFQRIEYCEQGYTVQFHKSKFVDFNLF